MKLNNTAQTERFFGSVRKVYAQRFRVDFALEQKCHALFTSEMSIVNARDCTYSRLGFSAENEFWREVFGCYDISKRCLDNLPSGIFTASEKLSDRFPEKWEIPEFSWAELILLFSIVKWVKEMFTLGRATKHNELAGTVWGHFSQYINMFVRDRHEFRVRVLNIYAAYRFLPHSFWGKIKYSRNDFEHDSREAFVQFHLRLQICRLL